jgi:hypothetical protein
MTRVFALLMLGTLLHPFGMAEEFAVAARSSSEASTAVASAAEASAAETGAAEENSSGQGISAQPEGQGSSEAFIARHFRVLSLDTIGRYLYSDNARGIITDRESQYKVSIGLQVNFDAEGSTYLAARSETGNSFGNSWNNTGQGLGAAQTNFSVKTLFLGQKFGRRAEFQVGGIEFDRGTGSQATYAAGEGFLTGYRVRIVPSAGNWRPDAISLTFGQASDFGSPNVVSRLHRLGDVNYVQVLTQKKLGERDEASLEADSIAGIGYLRGALRAYKLDHAVFDDVLVEAIGRVSDGPAWAWSVTAGKDLDRPKNWRAEAIYVDMPAAVFVSSSASSNASSSGQVLQNWGEFGLGQRIGASLRYRVTRDFSLSFLGSRRTDDTPDTYRWRGFLAARYDFAPLARRALQHMK